MRGGRIAGLLVAFTNLRGAVEGAVSNSFFRNGLIAFVAGVAALLLSAAPTFAFEDHVVQPGETLFILAARYGFPVDTLVDLNGLASADDIKIGQVIRIPGKDATPGAATVAPGSGQTHKVQPGEALSSIADKYGVPLAQWVSLNGLSSPDAIFAGQLLQVPGGGASAPASGGLAASGKSHKVALGESLSKIADLYNVPLALWVELNHLSSADAIYAGQVLEVPGSGAFAAGASTPSSGATPSGRTHAVRAGETLSRSSPTTTISRCRNGWTSTT